MSNLDYMVVSVFDPKSEPIDSGNLLAVFQDGGDFTAEQMQRIAHELKPPSRYQENFSETAFVTDVEPDSYSVRIFTPQEELAFAGHPTLGTAWVLKRLGKIAVHEVQQLTAAGRTRVSFRDGSVWFRRSGSADADLRVRDEQVDQKVAKALGLAPGEIGLEPRELGRSLDRLHPAETDVGIRHLLIPVRDQAALGRCRPVPHLVDDLGDTVGTYCFTATRAGAVRARGFFPSLGIAEDAATGSAAAGLGVYLVSRLGPIDLVIDQGVEMGRPSRLLVRASADHVDVGGRCELVMEGSLVTLP